VITEVEAKTLLVKRFKNLCDDVPRENTESSVGAKLPPRSAVPLASTEKRLAVDDVATLKTTEVPLAVVDATLKATVVDVAPTPATKPLSMKRPVERVVGDVQRARRPFEPPARAAVIPSDDVATQRVDVPIDWRTIPRVPVELVPSKSDPMRVRLVVVPLVIRSLVEKRFVDEAIVVKNELVVALVAANVVAEALFEKNVVAVALVAKKLDDEAFTAAKLLVAVALVNVAAIALKNEAKRLVLVLLVVEPLVAVKLVAVALAATRFVVEASVE
jgi:hypothetical protein